METSLKYTWQESITEQKTGSKREKSDNRSVQHKQEKRDQMLNKLPYTCYASLWKAYCN